MATPAGTGLPHANALVPTSNLTVHCAGQSNDAFASYTAFMSPNSTAPAVSMTYVGLDGLRRHWFDNLRATLEEYEPSFVIPQIGLHLPNGANLSGVADGTYDVELQELVAGLKLLGRPSYVRVGYEFNGQWNNYPPTAYVSAWDTIVGTWRRQPELAGSVAAVWDFSCDAAPSRLDWRGWLTTNATTEPDWWGVNIFGGNARPDANCVRSFVSAAEAARKPVMLGESTPRTLTVLDAPWSLARWNGHAGLCMGVSGASSVDASSLVVWTCAGVEALVEELHEAEDAVTSKDSISEPSASSRNNQLWRLNPDGYLVNYDGKCVAVAADGRRAVTGECGGTDPGPAALRWTWSGAQLTTRTANGSAACLSVGGVTRGVPLVLSSSCGANNSSSSSSGWSLEPQPGSGGNVTWSSWFEPYLALVALPAVRAFCYIDWFWPRRSSLVHGFGWYDWGDARVEYASIVGRRWRLALQKRGTFVHSANRSATCRVLGC